MQRQGKYVVIIDYGLGNLYSILNACQVNGITAVVSSDKDVLNNAAAVILPGVGAFAEAMNNMRRLDLISPIKDFALTGKPLVGVCLGMQLLLSESEEFGVNKGLGLIDGVCCKFPEEREGKRIRIPQIMWNEIYTPPGNERLDSHPLLEGIAEHEFMYFVHSYYVKPAYKENELTLTNYEGVEYASSVYDRNITGFQFHPEKSGIKGLLIYKNLRTLLHFDKLKVC